MSVLQHVNYRKYADRVTYELAQQKVSRLLPHVRTEFGVTGIAFQVKGIGRTKMQPMGPARSERKLSSIDQPSSWVVPGDPKEVALDFTELNRIQMGYDPSADFLRELSNCNQRDTDDTIIGKVGDVGGLLGSATRGAKLESTVALPSAQIIDCPDGFTWDKLVEASFLKGMKEEDDPDDMSQWSLLPTPRAIQQLAQSGPQFFDSSNPVYRFGNDDVTALQMYRDGKPSMLQGFNFIPKCVRPALIDQDTPAAYLPVDGGTAPSGYDYCIAFRKSAIQYAAWGSYPKFWIEKLPNLVGETYAAIINKQDGAVRDVDTGVIVFKVATDY